MLIAVDMQVAEAIQESLEEIKARQEYIQQ
jgi:hypothetical protein